MAGLFPAHQRRQVEPEFVVSRDQHFDRVPVDDAYCASADRFLLEAGIVCGRLELTLAENGKKTGENQRGDESDGHMGASRARVVLTDAYRLTFGSHPTSPRTYRTCSRPRIST